MFIHNYGRRINEGEGIGRKGDGKRNIMDSNEKKEEQKNMTK